MKERQPYSVGGKWRTGDRINEILFPCNDEVIASVCHAAQADIEDAIQAAVVHEVIYVLKR